MVDILVFCKAKGRATGPVNVGALPIQIFIYTHEFMYKIPIETTMDVKDKLE